MGRGAARDGRSLHGGTGHGQFVRTTVIFCFGCPNESFTGSSLSSGLCQQAFYLPPSTKKNTFLQHSTQASFHRSTAAQSWPNTPILPVCPSFRVFPSNPKSLPTPFPSPRGGANGIPGDGGKRDKQPTRCQPSCHGVSNRIPKL